MALRSTQPLVKMSTRNIPGGRGCRYVRLTTSLHSCAECHEIWEPKPPGTLWATPGLLRETFTFFIVNCIGAAILASGERLGTPCAGSYVGLGSGLDCSKELSHPTGVRNPGRSTRSESLHRIYFPATCNVIYTREL